MKKEFMTSERQFLVTENMPLVADDSKCYELVLCCQKDLSNSVFTVTATRSDGETFTDIGSVSGKTARYVLANNMYAKEGPLIVRTTITDAEGFARTINEITFNVIRGTNSDEALKADTNYPVMTQLILRVEELTGSIPAAEDVINKAAEAAEKAETAAIFAKTASEKAESAGNAAQTVADKASGFLDKVDEITDALPPVFSQEDEGKILYLAKNGTVSEIASASLNYGEEDGIILDAGILDDEMAFIDISGAELSDIGIENPLDERCMFSFQLMPDSLDYTTDFDISAEAVEETDGGYRMIFPAAHCEPFAENNIQSASDLFAIFEKVQFNADFPKDLTTPSWGSPDDVLPAAFLDEKVISPAVRLSKEYTDEVAGKAEEKAKSYTDKMVGECITISPVVLRSAASNEPLDVSQVDTDKLRFVRLSSDFNVIAGTCAFVPIDAEGNEGEYTFGKSLLVDADIVIDVVSRTMYRVFTDGSKEELTDGVLDGDFYSVLENIKACIVFSAEDDIKVEFWVVGSAGESVDSKTKIALQYANAYTGKKLAFILDQTKAHTNKRVGKPTAVVKCVDTMDGVPGFSKIILPSYMGTMRAGVLVNDTNSYATWTAFTEPGETLIFDIENKESNLVIVVNEATGERTTREDTTGVLANMDRCDYISSEYANCTFYYYTDCGTAIDTTREYTDSAIQKAIIDSWEVAV